METDGINGLSFATINNAPIDFYTNGNNHRMTITGSGNVGIGTISPNFALDVKTGTKPVIAAWGSIVDRTYTGSSPDEPAFATYSYGGTKFGIGHSWGALSLLAYDIDTYGAGNIKFYTGNNAEGQPCAERMIITRTGNVGIKTTNPASPLEVNGVIHSTSGGVKFPDNTVQTTAYTGTELKELIKQNQELRIELEQLRREIENLKTQINIDNK